jgi:Flp pilus assembly protein TadG
MFLRERIQPRRGSVAVTTAVMMVVLLGITAIALDGGSLLAERRHAQGTADAAALAAAGDLYKNWNTDKGVDRGASATALAVAAANGYKNDASPDLGMANNYRTSSVVVNIPPKTGLFTGQNGYVEVQVTYYAPRFFSNIFGRGSLPVFARTVARGMQMTSTFGMLILDPKSSGSLTAGGNGGLTETGGAILVNSTSGSAVNCNGNGTITAQELDVTGGYSGGSSQIMTAPISGNINTGVPTTADPLRFLQVPSQPASANYTYDKVTHTYTLPPGSYGKLPNFTNGDTVIFEQASAGNGGIFYLNNGFNANGAVLKMDTNTTGGMMIYNAGTGGNDGISITGDPTGGITLTGLTSGVYAGMVIFQARNAYEPLSITGNGNVNIVGNIYAAGATLKMAGNGTGNNIASQYISQDLVITGSGNLTVKDNQNTNPPVRKLQIVE